MTTILKEDQQLPQVKAGPEHTQAEQPGPRFHKHSGANFWHPIDKLHKDSSLHGKPKRHAEPQREERVEEEDPYAAYRAQERPEYPRGQKREEEHDARVEELLHEIGKRAHGLDTETHRGVVHEAEVAGQEGDVRALEQLLESLKGPRQVSSMTQNPSIHRPAPGRPEQKGYFENGRSDWNVPQERFRN